MSGCFRYLLITSAILFSYPSWAADDASEATSSTRADTVTVVGNWLDSPDYDTAVLDHAGARTIVTQEQAKEKGAETVAEALRGIPGVQVQENNGTGGSDISLNVGVRGLTSRLSPRSTIMMDGVPLSVAPYGQPQLSMAPLSMGNIQSVDVIRGGSAVRYGPQNVGGVINFVSKAIPEEFGGSVSAQTESASYGRLKTLTSTSVGGTAENGFGAEILYSGLHGQGYRENNDNTDIDDVMLKTKYDLSPRDQLTGNFHYYTATAGMPGGLTPEQYRENPFQSVRPFDQFEGRRQDMSFRYRHMGDESQFAVLTYFTKSFRTSDIQNDGTGANEGQSRFVAAPRHYTTWAIEPTWSRLFHFQGMAHEVTFGYRYLNETQDEKAYRSDWYDPASTWSAPDSKQNYYQHTSGGTAANAFYIDDTINVSNWTITPGLRYESIRTHVRDSFADIDRQKSYSEPLPSLNVMYHLSDSWKLFANANTSFGSLQYAQLTRGGNHGQPAPGLKPEKARTYEIGTRYDDTVLKAELTAFYIDFDNQLQYISNTVGWTTLGATRHQGIELAFNYDLSDMATTLDGASVYSTYTYTRAVSTSGDFANKDLPLYSRQVFTVGGRYATGNWVWSLDGYSQSGQQSPGSATSGNGYITKESDDGQYGYIPGYMVWGARGEYDMGPAWHNLKLAAGIKNLLDKRYFTRSTDNNYGKYVGEPRTYYVQASVIF